MEERNAGSEEAAGIFEQRDAGRREETDPDGFGRGDQADFAVWDQAAGAASDSVCAGEQADAGDSGAQGKYSEVYGGRVSRLGIRVGGGRVSRGDGDGTGELDS